MYCLTNKDQMILKKNVFCKGNFTLLKYFNRHITGSI